MKTIFFLSLYLFMPYAILSQNLDSLLRLKELQAKGYSEANYGLKLIIEKEDYSRFKMNSNEGALYLYLWKDSIFEYEKRISLAPYSYSIGKWSIKNDTLMLFSSPSLPWRIDLRQSSLERGKYIPSHRNHAFLITENFSMLKFLILE